MMQTAIPHLVDTSVSKQLIVHGKPFLMLAGELQNSSLSDSGYMDTVWQNMVDTNINTLLGSVSWEMIEPVEDHFNFDELDKVILGARKHGLHLVLLWFGAFKNGVSTYAPSWVKTFPKRFPRAKLRKAGGIVETSNTLSIFHPEVKSADIKAFTRLMAHIKLIDAEHSTVLMVQVENEVGLLGDSRDASDAANKVFSEPVPSVLADFLRKDWERLHTDIKPALVEFEKRQINQDNTNWETVFGKSLSTDELFMAYHYALYVNDVAAAGKAAYPLPMFANVWQNLADDGSDPNFRAIAGGGSVPGDYPSGGGTTNVLDIWLEFAPILSFIAPDIYLSDYSSLCAKYRHRNQPLFVPEQRRDEYGARRIWIALGSHAALGVSPFGIDTVKAAVNPFTKHYGLLKSVSTIVLEAQRTENSSIGFCFDEVEQTHHYHPIVRSWEGYEILIERAFVFGKPQPASGMVIHRGNGVFLLIGWGFQVSARALDTDASFTGILRFEEKYVMDATAGDMRTGRTLNGDESRSGASAVMPSEDPDYGGFPISVTIPARTMIAEVEFYHLKRDA